MNKNWKAVGIGAIAVALLYYPAMKLYKHLASKNDNVDDVEDKIAKKVFSPSYRSKHKMHNRHNTDHVATGKA